MNEVKKDCLFMLVTYFKWDNTGVIQAMHGFLHIKHFHRPLLCNVVFVCSKVISNLKTLHPDHVLFRLVPL